jgi:hypothetical protein
VNGSTATGIQSVTILEGFDGLLLHADKVLKNLGGADLESPEVPEVRQVGEAASVIDLEGGLNRGSFHFQASCGVQESHGEEVIVFQNLAGYAELLGDEPDGSNAASLAIAPVGHLLERLEQMAGRDFFAAGHPDHPAAALRFALPRRQRHSLLSQEGFSGGDDFLDGFCTDHGRAPVCLR